MSSLARMLAVLDLFSVEKPIWPAEDIAASLACSRPQGYRYIRELCKAGLLIRFAGGYALGPRAIEIDYLIRQGDPLLQASEPIMRAIRDRHGCDVLLASMVGDRIIAIHHERGETLTTVAFGRGRLMPLFRGAGSKVIVANLPTAQQKRLVANNGDDLRQSTFGREWPDVQRELRAIRRSGFALSIGELEPVNVGIAVPVRVDQADAPSSLVLVVHRSRFETINLDAIVQIAKDRSSEIGRILK